MSPRLKEAIRRRSALGAATMAVFVLAVLVFHACSSSSPRRPRIDRGTPTVRSDAKGCLGCHDDFRRAMDGRSLHYEDFESRCEDCHGKHGLVGVLKLNKPEPELCLDCHTDLASELENGHPHMPFGAGSCTSCHDPHGSTLHALRKHSDSSHCFECHDRASFEHGPLHVPDMDCAVCHDPHANATESGLSEPMGTLCAKCHDPRAEVLRRGPRRVTTSRTRTVDPVTPRTRGSGACCARRCTRRSGTGTAASATSTPTTSSRVRGLPRPTRPRTPSVGSATRTRSGTTSAGTTRIIRSARGRVRPATRPMRRSTPRC